MTENVFQQNFLLFNAFYIKYNDEFVIFYYIYISLIKLIINRSFATKQIYYIMQKLLN